MSDKRFILPDKLKAYSSHNYVDQMKAIFLNRAIIVIIFFLFILITTLIFLQYYTFGKLIYSVFVIELSCLAAAFYARSILLKGKLNTSIHLIFFASFTTVWTILFTSPGSDIARLDTISFIYAIFALFPLLSRKLSQIVLYSALNIITLIVFSFFLYHNAEHSSADLLDFFLDNIIAFLFVTIITSILSNIYNNAIDRSEHSMKEAQTAQKNVAKLNEELEEKVVIRTEELNKALESLEESNHELKVLNDSISDEARKLNLLNDKLAVSEYKLQIANSTKDKFFSIIAHDLRNPIGGIRNLLEMMKIYRSNMSDDEFSKIIETSYNASTSTYELLENLLEWANIQKGKIKYEPMINSLHESVELAIKHAHIIAHNKEIAIKNEVADSVYAYYDKGLLSIVLRNLITNSVKYSYKESEIKIWQKNNSEDSDQDNHKDIVLAVSDNGIGMHEETIDNIFKIDQVKSKPGTQNEKGSGLGLILCKEFIEINNGKIWVESEIKKGSTFYFSLPKEN